MRDKARGKQRPQERAKRSLPRIEDTEFGEDKLISKAIQRSYNQSGIIDEPLTDEDE